MKDMTETILPSGPLPKLVAFDIDYTLWDLWIDTHITGPLKREGNTLNEVLDRRNERISFYPHVPRILHALRDFEITIAAASRTYAPDLAHSALNLLLVPPKSHSNPMVLEHRSQSDVSSQPGDILRAKEFFDILEIYPGSKISHFKAIHKKTGLPYSEMLFFDDEHRNVEVEQLGVTFQLVPHGMNHTVFHQGIEKWRHRNARTSA